MNLKNMNVVVTGGSKGLGLGLVEAFVSHGAKVTVVARSADALDSVRAQLGVATACADVTDAQAAQRILFETRPDLLVLNAGARVVGGARGDRGIREPRGCQAELHDVAGVG